MPEAIDDLTAAGNVGRVSHSAHHSHWQDFSRAKPCSPRRSEAQSAMR